MKVLMFGWEFPPHISGGLGTACYGLTKALSSEKVDVTFVLPKLQGDYSNAPVKIVGPKSAVQSLKLIKTERETETYEHIKKILKVDSSLMPYMNDVSYKEYIDFLKKNNIDIFESGEISSDFFEFSGNYGDNLMEEVYRYAMAGRLMAKQEEFEVIHAHDWMTYQAGIEAKQESGRPLVIHVHATEFDRTGNNVNTQIYEIEKHGMDMADGIIAVSEKTRQTVIDKYKQDPSKVHVVYNAVEKDDIAEIKALKKIKKFKDDKVVLFLGRITCQKGPEYFVHAAQMVLQKNKNVRFVMAGSGDLGPKMIELMASLNIADKFHFTGFLDAEKRERVFSMTDLFIMPSVSEPFGITPLEAMKHDIPVIISKQSGIAEILPSAVKLDFWDVHKLSESILSLLGESDKVDQIVEKGQEVLDGINWIDSARETMKVYNSYI